MRTKLGTHGATALSWFRLWNLSPSLSLLGIQGLGHKVFFFLTPRPSHYSFSFQTFGRVGKHPAYTKPPTITEQPLPAGSSWRPKASGADNQRLMNEWNCLRTDINTEVADVKEDASRLCGNGRTSWRRRRRSAWDTSDNRKLGEGTVFVLSPGYATGLRADANV